MQEVAFLNGKPVEYPMVIVAEPRERDPRVLHPMGPRMYIEGPSVDLWLCEELPNGQKRRERPILSSEKVEVKRFICKGCTEGGSSHADFCEFGP